jgi:hypothetical protein
MEDEGRMHALLLVVHVASGSAGLLLGPVAMIAPKRRGRHTRAGGAYQVAVGALTASAVGLALLDWRRLWWLALIAVATEAAAMGGLRVRRRRRPGWRSRHVRLMCGSYVSLTTALLVVNWGSPAAWVLPTVVATPLISWAARRADAVPRAGQAFHGAS